MSKPIPFESDIADKLRVFYNHVYSVSCAGGRTIAKGYVCPHCESVNPSEDCRAPKPEFAPKPPAKKRGRKLTTGKYATRKELEDNVRFFATYQSEAQVGRTCGVSFATVANILRPKS